MGIKEEPTAVSYPWTIKRESTNEILPASKSILEIFNEIGLGRSLLILGAPGSGKTTMLLELARQLIERAHNDETEPIPVVFNLASWTEKQSLADWLAEQLNIVYYVPKRTAPKWVNENRMLLLLDGLDEVKQESRAKCVDIINQFRNEQGLTSLVICSRIREYQEVNQKLAFVGAITLQPLTPIQVNAYFDKFGKILAGVKQLLRKDKTLQELAETPLMLSIMVLAYKDIKTDELIVSSNIEEQRKRLFDIYIDSMFKRPSRSKYKTYRMSQIRQWLSWLAYMMLRHNQIPFLIHRMQADWLSMRGQNISSNNKEILTQILITGLSVGLIGVFVGTIVRGLIGLFIFGLGYFFLIAVSFGASGEIKTVDTLTFSWKNFLYHFIWKLPGVLIFGYLLWLLISFPANLPTWVTNLFISRDLDYAGFVFILIIYLGFVGVYISWALADGLAQSLRFGQIEKASTPYQRLYLSIRNAITIIISVELLFAVISWLASFLLEGGNNVLPFGLELGRINEVNIGLVVGFVLGLPLAVRYGGNAFIQHFLIRYVLSLNGFLPWRLVKFLDYATDLIFLHRVGEGYIFIHRTFMEHFAEMDV